MNPDFDLSFPAVVTVLSKVCWSRFISHRNFPWLLLESPLPSSLAVTGNTPPPFPPQARFRFLLQLLAISWSCHWYFLPPPPQAQTHFTGLRLQCSVQPSGNRTGTSFHNKTVSKRPARHGDYTLPYETQIIFLCCRFLFLTLNG